MDIYKFEYLEENKRNYWLLIAIILSLIIHLVVLLIFNCSDVFSIDLSPDKEKEIPKEVTFIFPENKPKQVVENINEDEQTPDFSDFLSDKNSRAKNPNLLEETGNLPFSQGNVPLANLSQPQSNPAYTKSSPMRKFNKDALTGDYTDNTYQSQHQNQAQNAQSVASEGTNNMLEQKQFSADQLGDVSLSTYAWDFAPYINYFKKKIYQVWYAPAAYYQLGLIHGFTVIQISINRDGSLIGYDVLHHEGHESLQQSSESAVKAVFPLKKLPNHFPEKTLTLTFRMIYPNLRQGSN